MPLVQIKLSLFKLVAIVLLSMIDTVYNETIITSISVNTKAKALFEQLPFI